MWYKIIGEPDIKISPQGSGNIKMNKNEVTTLTSLVDEGKKIARLSGNRDLNEKIVKAKMKTLEECGQLIPAIVVDATDVMNQGLEVVDFTTGDIIREEEAVDYWCWWKVIIAMKRTLDLWRVMKNGMSKNVIRENLSYCML